mgnify:CR=1 FL=1
MREKVENMLWRTMWKLNEKFVKDEEGDSNMVAVVVLIVIIVVVAAIFQEQLTDAVEATFDRLMNFVEQ